MKPTPRSVPVPIRLDAALRKSIRAAARRTHTNVSALMRFAIVNQLEEIERTGHLRISATKADA